LPKDKSNAKLNKGDDIKLPVYPSRREIDDMIKEISDDNPNGYRIPKWSESLLDEYIYTLVSKLSRGEMTLSDVLIKLSRVTFVIGTKAHARGWDTSIVGLNPVEH
jgi:hypothetical protein